MEFDVLTSIDSINQPLFIEASAGTGKTFTIEHLTARRLLEPLPNGDHVPINTIAIVTFTNACARELSMRIRTTLEKNIALLKKTISDDDPAYIKKIKDMGFKEIAQAKHLLMEALSCYGDACITTIHSFCLRILSEYEGEALRLWSAKELLQNIRDYFYYSLDDDLFFPEQFSVLVAAEGGFSHLVERVVKMLWKSERSQPVQANKIWEKLLQEVRKWPVSEEVVRALLEKECERYINVSSKTGIKSDVQEKIDAFANLFSIEPRRQRQIFCPLFFSDIFKQLKVKTKQAEPSPILEFIKTKIEPLMRELADRDKLFIKLVYLVEDFLERKQDASHAMSIERVLVRTWQKTQEVEFQQFLRQKFHAVIIDEFQDTDPLQWKIFQTTFLDSRSFLYLVGDPKQAIYRFRGADVYSYLDAKRYLDRPGFVKTLTKNFRSTAALNSALNKLFADDAAKDLFLLPKTNERVTASLLHSRHQTHVQEAAFIFCIGEGLKGRALFFPTRAMEEELFFPFIAEKIRRPSSETYAILVKDRYQAKRVKTFLQQRGIESCGFQLEPLVDGACFQFLQRLVPCLKNSRNSRSMLALLLAAPFQYGEHVVRCFHEIGQEALFKRAFYVEKMITLQKSLYGGIASFFMELLDMIPKASLEEEFLTDLEQFFDLMAAYPEKIESVRQLERFLHSVETLPEDEAPSRAQPQDCSVSVLTVHKSKGLEFDVVFSLGTAFYSREGEDQDEVDSEKLRLFYVAATRAKSKLYQFVAIASDTKEEWKARSPVDLYLNAISKEGHLKAIDKLIGHSAPLSVDKIFLQRAGEYAARAY